MSCCHGYTLTDGCESVFAVDVSAHHLRPRRPLRGGRAAPRARLPARGRSSPTRRSPASRRSTRRLASLLAARARRGGVRRGARRADRRVVPRRDRLRARRVVRRLPLGGRRLGHRHVQGGDPLRHAPGRAARVRQRAHRRRARRPGPAAAARRLPHDLRHGERVHRHRRLRLPQLRAKTGIASRRLRPDAGAHRSRPRRARCPRWSSPRAASTCSATRSSRTRRGPSRRARAPTSPAARPMSQGRNPWSDVGAMEALRLAGKYLVRAVRDASDDGGARGALVGRDARGHRLRQRGRAPAARDELLGRRPRARLPVRRATRKPSRWCRTGSRSS